MGIKNPRTGVIPTYDELWKETAKDGRRLDRARELYMRMYPSARLVDAHKAVQDFRREHLRRYGHLMK